MFDKDSVIADSPRALSVKNNTANRIHGVAQLEI